MLGSPQPLRVLLLLLVLGGGISWGSFSVLSTAREELERNLHALRDCEMLSREIQRVRGEPERARLEEVAPPELTRALEAKAAESGIAPEKILRIEPEPARRLGSSPYEVKPTRVELRDVSLPDLFRLLYALTGEDTALSLEEIKLDTPAGEEVGSIWLVEVTLGHRIYSPKERRTER